MKALSDVSLLAAYFPTYVLNRFLVENSLAELESQMQNYLDLIDPVLGKYASAITETGGYF
jgi:hypothetical protein